MLRNGHLGYTILSSVLPHFLTTQDSAATQGVWTCAKAMPRLGLGLLNAVKRFGSSNHGEPIIVQRICSRLRGKPTYIQYLASSIIHHADQSYTMQIPEIASPVPLHD